jgi:hypothetical protein
MLSYGYGKDQWNCYCENWKQSGYKLDTLLFRFTNEAVETKKM